MAKMYKVKVEGTYYTQTDGQKEYSSFEFEKEIPFIPESWLNSMIQARYLPIWLRKEVHVGLKKPKYPKAFDGLKTCRLVEFKIIDKKDGLVGKDLLKIETEEELQDVAVKYLLIEVPLPYTTSVQEVKNKCAEQYLKIVKGLKFDTEQEKQSYSFFKKTSLGEWVLDFSEQSFIMEEVEHKVVNFDAPVEKKSLEDILGAKELTTDELLAGL